MLSRQGSIMRGTDASKRSDGKVGIWRGCQKLPCGFPDTEASKSASLSKKTKRDLN